MVFQRPIIGWLSLEPVAETMIIPQYGALRAFEKPFHTNEMLEAVKELLVVHFVSSHEDPLESFCVVPCDSVAFFLMRTSETDH